MPEPSYRMSMLPFGTYPNEDGAGEHLGFAVPGMIQEPINALSRLFGTPSNPGTFGQGPDAPGNKEDMTTLLMSMYGGNAMNPAAVIPKGSLASNAFKAAERLPMDEASRLARAREFGFDTESTAYRGLTRPFDEGDTGYYQMFTSDPVEASEYAMKNPLASPNVVPAYLRMGKTLEVDAGGSNFNRIFTGGIPQEVRLNGLDSIASMDELAHAARNSGYDSLRVRNVFDNVTNEKPSFTGAPAKSNPGMTDDELLAELGLEPLPPSTPSSDSSGFRDLEMSQRRPVTVSTIFDPVRIRSKFAAFNPADIDKAGLLLSDTGKPSLMGSAIAGAETPQRMYHGTASPDDFSMFRPSDSGSFGPGVYLSKDPEFAGTFAKGDQSRVLPVDVSGPLASHDDYLTTLHANGRNPEAALRALMDQGYTGVSGDVGGPGFSNVTNVFKPGSVRSATTGETLFSDTGHPSLFGDAFSGAQSDEDQRRQILNSLFTI